MRTTNIKGREGLVTCAGVEQSKKFSKKKRGEIWIVEQMKERKRREKIGGTEVVQGGVVVRA